MRDARFVRIVDDDATVLRSLDRLLRAAGFSVRTFFSSREFLTPHDRDLSGCLVHSREAM